MYMYYIHTHTMLGAAGWFHVLLECSTLWYCACVQLAPLPRLCLNTFPFHTLLGSNEGQEQPGSQAGAHSSHPSLPLAAQSLLLQQCLA